MAPSKMLGKAIGLLQFYLFVHYPRGDTFWNTDYSIEEQLKTTEERKKLKEDRFAGYKALCSFGLGSMFWSGATGVLADWKDKKGWIEYIYIHSAVTFVLLLNGLVASTFRSTAWFAPCAAGFGSWSALVLFLGTAHLMSLKFHTYETECFYSLVASTATVTIYWAVSVHDPLPLYICVKTIFWIVGLVFYITCSLLYCLLFLLWSFAWTSENSIKNRLVNCLLWKFAWTSDNSIKNRLVNAWSSPRDKDASAEEHKSLLDTSPREQVLV